jgi:YebC/PmpR family DNA-binding regulatory protein
MSGHSHWHSIRHQKGITDAKKSKVFSKISRIITLAAKEGGGNPNANAKLRLAIEQGKEANLPGDTIEKAIKRGTGEIEGAKYEEFSFEAYGPGGIALLIDGITDNKNRTLGEIKQILNQHNGKLVESGVRWLFDRKGSIILDLKMQIENLKNREQVELLAIEAGADDLLWKDDALEIYTTPENLESTKKSMEEKGVKIQSSAIGWKPKTEVEVDQKTKEAAENLFEALDENDAVQEIYSNIK